MADVVYTLTKRQRLNLTAAALKQDRTSYDSHYRELSSFIAPDATQFSVSERVSKGQKKNSNIIDSTASVCARTLESGMMSGITSPARDWFRLGTPDPKLNESGAVKEYLYEVNKRMNSVFLRSNLYNILPILYGQSAVFSTGAMMVEEDFQTVVRFKDFPVGSYWIGEDAKGKVNIFMREFSMTVRQIVEKFCGGPNQVNQDISNLSDRVQTLWKDGKFDEWIDVTHIIYPNEDHQPKRLESKYKKFSSCYYESGTNVATSLSDADKTKFLSESGYDRFPVLALRWRKNGDTAYGTSSPGMVALGDTKQLQHGEKRAAQAVDKMVNPPMLAPTSARSSKLSILSGDTSYIDDREGLKGTRPLHEVNFNIQQLEVKQEQIRERIRKVFYTDLFRAILDLDRRQMTAEEVRARESEKIQELGPVLERLNQDVLDPLIDHVYAIMEAQGLLPEAPQELQGADLRVEYISIMAQAQKALGLSSLERFTNFAFQIASQDPSALDSIDVDKLLSTYAEQVGNPPGIIRATDAIEAIRQARNKAQQAQQGLEMAKTGAEAANKLAGSSTEGDNALTQLLGAGNGRPASLVGA